MRRRIWGTVGLSVALNASFVFAGDRPEVIAASAARPPASLGAPVAQIGAPQPVSAVSPALTYRGQKDDKPLIPTTDGAPAPQPLHAPMPTGPMSSGPMPAGPLTGTPFPAGPAVNGPATNGPIVSSPGGTTYSSGPPMLEAPQAIMPSVPCANCMPGQFDPSHAPLPGGVFAAPVGDPGSRLFVSGEYLYWWTRGQNVPVLVTTGPVTNAVPGLLNNPVLAPNTQVLFGGDDLDNKGRSGYRFDVGYWLGACKGWAIEGSYFALGERNTSYSANSNAAGSPVLGRPFFEDNRQVESIDYAAFPGVFRGGIAVETSSNFWGANLDVRRKLWCGCGFRVDGQIGFRYLRLDEDIQVSENSTFLIPITAGGVTYPVGTTSAVQDSFRAANDFYGVLLGLNSEFNRGPWSLQLITKVSLGTNRQSITVEGGQQITPPVVVPPGNFNQGLLARNSNIGTYTSNQFSVIPEIGFNVGYQFTPHWRVFAGYSMIYWNDVVRAGDQIDRNVNVTGVPFFRQPGQVDNTGAIIPPGSSRPAPLLRETDFWAQGVNVGVQWTW